MIRFSTVFSLGLAVALGLGLYRLTYEVQTLEEELNRINRQTIADQEATHVLKAEWAMLTQSERLGDMAQRHLSLAPVTAAQLGTYDTLPLKGDRSPESPEGGTPTLDILKAMQVAQNHVEPGHVDAQRPAAAVSAASGTPPAAASLKTRGLQ